MSIILNLLDCNIAHTKPGCPGTSDHCHIGCVGGAEALAWLMLLLFLALGLDVCEFNAKTGCNVITPP